MYLDGTEEAVPVPPTHCPICKGRLTTKWSANIQHRHTHGYFAVAFPAHVCKKCKITVRVLRKELADV